MTPFLCPAQSVVSLLDFAASHAEIKAPGRQVAKPHEGTKDVITRLCRKIFVFRFWEIRQTLVGLTWEPTLVTSRCCPHPWAFNRFLGAEPPKKSSDFVILLYEKNHNAGVAGGAHQRAGRICAAIADSPLSQTARSASLQHIPILQVNSRLCNRTLRT